MKLKLDFKEGLETTIFILLILAVTIMSSTITANQFWKQFNSAGYEKIAPSDYFSEAQIETEDTVLTLQADRPVRTIGTKATGSMLPVVNEYSDAIVIKPKDESEIHAGDLIVYKLPKGLVFHRVVKILIDDNGETYFIAKGDNNNIEDDYKIYFKNIVYKVVGVLY